MQFSIDFSNKRAIAGAIILVCILGLVFYAPEILRENAPEVCYVDGVCQHEKQSEFLIALVPVLVLGGIIIGAGVFFFMASKLENKKKDLEKATQALIQFLNKDERKVIENILENKGKVFQSEISRIEGIGKLKSHRILQRLSDRGVIEIEKHGKTNIIRLAKNIRETLIK